MIKIVHLKDGDNINRRIGTNRHSGRPRESVLFVDTSIGKIVGRIKRAVITAAEISAKYNELVAQLASPPCVVIRCEHIFL
jgi:hypothetical protein